MKTLREMMDQIDEINRRDLLKGAGVAALAGAAGYKLGKDSTPADLTIPNTPEVYWLIGYIYLLATSNHTSPVKQYQEEIRKFIQATEVEMGPMEPVKKNKLSNAYHDGATAGSKMAEYFARSNGQSLTTGAMQDEKVGKRVAEEIKPYYAKLQTLVRQPVQEASPEAMAKIDKLSRN